MCVSAHVEKEVVESGGTIYINGHPNELSDTGRSNDIPWAGSGVLNRCVLWPYFLSILTIVLDSIITKCNFCKFSVSIFSRRFLYQLCA